MSKSKARAADAALEAPFWERKPLHEMTPAEWESLCDGCGQCCLIKVEEEVTGDIYLTRLACRLLDTRTCRCRDYARRHTRVPDCVTISPGNVRAIEWLPRSCAYRRLAEEFPQRIVPIDGTQPPELIARLVHTSLEDVWVR